MMSEEPLTEEPETPEGDDSVEETGENVETPEAEVEDAPEQDDEEE
jgi:hypothetical protein